MKQGHFTNREIIDLWAAHAEGATASFDEEGNFARKHLLNPAISLLLRSVAGKSGIKRPGRRCETHLRRIYGI